MRRSPVTTSRRPQNKRENIPRSPDLSWSEWRNRVKIRSADFHLVSNQATYIPMDNPNVPSSPLPQEMAQFTHPTSISSSTGASSKGSSGKLTHDTAQHDDEITSMPVRAPSQAFFQRRCDGRVPLSPSGGNVPRNTHVARNCFRANTPLVEGVLQNRNVIRPLVMSTYNGIPGCQRY